MHERSVHGAARIAVVMNVGVESSPRNVLGAVFQELVDPRSPGVERTPVPGVPDDADIVTKLGGRLTPVDSLQLLTKAHSGKLLGITGAEGWSKLREHAANPSAELLRDINRNKTLLGLSVKVRPCAATGEVKERHSVCADRKGLEH